MAFKNKQIMIRYVGGNEPKIYSYLVEVDKKSSTILSKNELVLESFQHEKGLMTDNQVLGDKVIQNITLLDKQVKDGIVFLYDMPNILRFNTVVPKASLSKAFTLAKKELNDFFKDDASMYEVTPRSVSTPDKGIIFYFDLLPNSIFKGFETLATAMDRYIDMHASFPLAVAAAVEKTHKEKTDMFLIYEDEAVNHILLLIENKMVDCLSNYKKLTLKEMVSAVELLRNKHGFAFEHKDINNVLMISKDKESYLKELKEKYLFDVLDLNITTDDIVITSVTNIKNFKDGFNIKV